MSRAHCVSDDGLVVGGISTSSNGNEAFRWTSSGGMVGLGDLPGGNFKSSIWRVSSNGDAMAGHGTTATGKQAVRWMQADGLKPLGDLAGGGSIE